MYLFFDTKKRAFLRADSNFSTPVLTYTMENDNIYICPNLFEATDLILSLQDYSQLEGLIDDLQIVSIEERDLYNLSELDLSFL